MDSQSAIFSSLSRICLLSFARSSYQALLINLTLFALYGLAEFRITKITANVFLIAFAFLFQKEDTPPAVKREGT